jgi:hypothetical protein
MATLKEQVRTDAWREIVAEDRRIIVTFGGESVYGFTGNISKDKSLVFAGLITDYKKSCWIEADAYDTMPEPNKLITVDSGEYLVLNMEEDAIGGFVRLDLGDQYT